MFVSYLTSVSLIKRSMTNVNGNGSTKKTSAYIHQESFSCHHLYSPFPVSPIPAFDIIRDYYYMPTCVLIEDL